VIGSSAPAPSTNRLVAVNLGRICSVGSAPEEAERAARDAERAALAEAERLRAEIDVLRGRRRPRG